MCEDKPAIAKGLCRGCYSREHRKTESGNAAMKRYNNGKGVDAAKRYREKNRENKPPKAPRVPKAQKPICSCGDVSVAKGLCRKCYNKQRWQSIAKKSGVKPRETKTITDIAALHEDLIKLVKSGMTIEAACKDKGVSRSVIYKRMTVEQKIELASWKAVSSVRPPKHLNDLDDPFT